MISELTLSGGPKIRFGALMHQRFLPFRHRFHVPVWRLMFQPELPQLLRGAGVAVDVRSWVSWHQRDHAVSGSAAGWCRQLLAEHQIDAEGPLWLDTMPRVLGFVFNPVSFWFAHDVAGQLKAIVCEVNNTFGERHVYLLRHQDGSPLQPGEVFRADKSFHVSPFFPVRGEYEFRFTGLSGPGCVRIDYRDQGRLQLVASLSLESVDLTRASLWQSLRRSGWLTLKVWLGIHAQALRLWWRGARFHRQPPPVAVTVTLATHKGDAA